MRSDIIIASILVFGMGSGVITILISEYFNRQHKLEIAKIDADVKLKAIEALKSNVELKIDLKDLKEVLK